MADLTVIALAEYDDGETESFATSVHGADVTRGELETTVGGALIEAGENMWDSIDTVDEFRDWAHEEVDGGTITCTSDGADNIPEGEEYCYTAYNERWTDVTLPDGWMREQSEVEGLNFRKESNVTTIDPNEWYVGGTVYKFNDVAKKTEFNEGINGNWYYFSQEDDIPLVFTKRVSEGFGEVSAEELIEVLEDNI